MQVWDDSEEEGVGAEMILPQPCPDDAVRAVEDEHAEVPSLLKGAYALERRVMQRKDAIHGHGERWGVQEAKSTSKRRVIAAAEACAVEQAAARNRLLEYVERLVAAGEFSLVGAFDHWSYDETPMKLKVFYDSQHGDVQKARVWAVENTFALLLQHAQFEGREEHQRPSGYLLVIARSSPAIRATQTAVGESIHKMLTSCTAHLNDLSGYPFKVRVSETDEAGANSRAEAMIQAEHPDWSHMWCTCLAHKIHTSAKKVWNLVPDLITGLKNTCLVLRGPGSMAAMRDHAKQLLNESFVFKRAHPNQALSRHAAAFKTKMKDTFSPSPAFPRKAAVVEVLCELLNADWQEEAITHVCAGCCQDAEEAKQKVTAAFLKFVTILRPPLMNTDNWEEWHHSLHLFGLGFAMHKIVPQVYARAFGRRQPDQDNEAVEPLAGGIDFGDAVPVGIDEVAVQRERLARIHRLGRQFMGSYYLHDLYLMKTALQPEIDLMKFALSQCGSKWELQQFQNVTSLGWRRYRLGVWHRAQELDACIWKTITNTRSVDTWSHMLEIEENRTMIWRMNLRLGACLFALVRVRVKSAPYPLWSLLTADSDDEKSFWARHISLTPACQRDKLTTDFCNAFPSLEEKLSEKALQILAAIGLLVATTTYSTERLHSKNSRAGLQRIQTHAADVASLAENHMGYVGPAWAAAARKDGFKHIAKEEAEPQEPPPKRRRGGGGAWRAFTHHHLAGRRFVSEDMTELKRRYWALSEPERARWKEIGRSGWGASS